MSDRSRVSASSSGGREPSGAEGRAPFPATDLGPRIGLGLRAQIVLALSVAFIAAFSLLGVATVQITERGARLERNRAAHSVARAFAAALDESGSDAAQMAPALAAVLLEDSTIAGIEVAWPGVEADAWGLLGAAPAATAELRAGGEVRLHMRPRPGGGAGGNLLLLYVAVTGGAILLLTYVILTYLIVRPLSALTEAAGRLARGGRHADVPVGRAAEVARLAVSFNRMAVELRDERQVLEERLAELEETTAELSVAQDQVVRGARLASVGRLSAGVAHEIGNPLAAILGMLELVRDAEVDPDDRMEFLGRIQTETERINRIIRDLLDFSRRGQEGAGDDVAAGETADVAEVVADAASLVAPQKDLRKITIERRVAEGLPMVRGAADQLTQVALNLLLNAADAIDGEGAILIEVDFHPDDDAQVRLCVSDSGPGIDVEILPHLFEPFVTSKPAGEGTGLGLAVTHALVERLGGHIHAENRDDDGARFVVDLPVAGE